MDGAHKSWLWSSSPLRPELRLRWCVEDFPGMEGIYSVLASSTSGTFAFTNMVPAYHEMDMQWMSFLKGKMGNWWPGIGSLTEYREKGYEPFHHKLQLLVARKVGSRCHTKSPDCEVVDGSFLHWLTKYEENYKSTLPQYKKSHWWIYLWLLLWLAWSQNWDLFFFSYAKTFESCVGLKTERIEWGGESILGIKEKPERGAFL